MALPYPSMDFVPLDVLRADELDQLVANIEYLNTQLGVTNSDVYITPGTVTFQPGMLYGTTGAEYDKMQFYLTTDKSMKNVTPVSANLIDGVNNYYGALWSTSDGANNFFRPDPGNAISVVKHESSEYLLRIVVPITATVANTYQMGIAVFGRVEVTFA